MFLILSDQEILSLSRADWQSGEELQSANLLPTDKASLYGSELGKTLYAAGCRRFVFSEGSTRERSRVATAYRCQGRWKQCR